MKQLLATLMLVLGAFTAQAQVKIGSNPTVASPTSNLEVEGSVGGNISKMAVTKDSSKVGIGNIAPTNKLHVTATANPVRFEGIVTGSGSETAVTVDANGVLKKQMFPTPTLRLAVGLSANYNAASNGAAKQVPLNTIGYSDGNFSTSTHLYTVPTSGYYQIGGVFSFDYNSGDNVVSINLATTINGSRIILNNISAGGYPPNGSLIMSGSLTIKLNAGDLVGLDTQSCGPSCPQNYTGTPLWTNLTIVKVN